MVDPILHDVSYTKDGKVTRPRVETVVRMHNALIIAHPAEAKKWRRTALTKPLAKRDDKALLFIAAHTMVETSNKERWSAQIHAWVEEYRVFCGEYPQWGTYFLYPNCTPTGFLVSRISNFVFS